MLTQEQFKGALPKAMQLRVTDDLVTRINDLLTDPLERDMLRDNILSYTSVLSNGRFKIEDYLYAVKYVSYKVMGNSNKAAYVKTFPDKYQEMVTRGLDEKAISSHVHAYNKGKLVNLILEQTLVPTYILNADAFQTAINKQLSLMNDPDVSHKVQSDAANSLLTHLKQPEASKVALDINVNDDSVISGLARAVRDLSERQLNLIGSGNVSAQSVAHEKLIIEHEPD